MLIIFYNNPIIEIIEIHTSKLIPHSHHRFALFNYSSSNPDQRFPLVVHHPPNETTRGKNMEASTNEISRNRVQKNERARACSVLTTFNYRPETMG